MVTSREAAPSVRLNADWQAKYRLRAQQFLTSPPQPPAVAEDSCGLLSVCVVGRSGVGKASLINHLLRQCAVPISHSGSFSSVSEEHIMPFYGLQLREIPSYDGNHALQPTRRRHHFHRSSHGSSSSSGGGSSRGSSCGSHSNTGGRLELKDFTKLYRLFEEDTKAIIFVVNNRITTEDQKLMELAIEHRKFFSVVRTHSDSLMRITDSKLLKDRLDELEEQVRKDLGLVGILDVRVFIVCIPWPEGKATDASLQRLDLEEVHRNGESLQFPLLESYLSQPKGLLDELQIFGYVKEEVWKALEPFHTVKKRHQVLDFSQHLIAGTLLPIAGPAMLSFSKTLYFTLRACSDVGLIEDADDAMQKVNAEANKSVLVTQIASKEGLLTAVHDSLVHIFGAVVVQIAIAEVVSTAAEATLSGTLPLVGPVISAADLPSRFRKIADKLFAKACLLHELWIMQNITGLLSEA